MAASTHDTDHAGFYTGVAGMAWVLEQVAERTGDEELRATARRGVEAVADRAIRDGDTAHWSDAPGPLFDGGAALTLLWAAARFDDTGLLDPVAAFGRHLLATGRPDDRGGLAWTGMAPHYHGVDDATWPNFFYGTSGSGLILASLAAATGDQEFLDGAQAAATNLRALADRVQTDDGEEGALLHYRDPDRRHHHYLGMCQGPIGTARFFHRLHEVTGDQADADWVELLANGLVASGAPRRHGIGYWNVDGLCCGGAGMAEFHLSRWATTGDDGHLARAEEAAAYLVGNAVNVDGKGPRWATAFTRVTPWDVHASSDWGHGATGIATALAHVWAARNHQFTARRLPDDPFPERTLA